MIWFYRVCIYLGNFAWLGFLWMLLDYGLSENILKSIMFVLLIAVMYVLVVIGEIAKSDPDYKVELWRRKYR